jgi:putative ABC transport system permease protein
VERERKHGWWAMSARLFGRSLGRRGATFFVAFVAVAGGSAVAATMLTIQADLRAKMTRELRRYGENLAIVPAEDRPGATLDEAALRRALGDAAAPVLLARGEITRDAPAENDGHAGPGEAVAVLGVDFTAHHRLHPSWRVDGAWPRGEYEVLLGAAAARRLDLAPGDRATLRLESGGEALPLRLAGTVRTGEEEEDQVFVPLPLLQARAGLAGRVSVATLFVEGGPAAVDAAGRRLETEIAGARARPLRPIAAAQGAILDRLDRMIWFMTAVILALACLCLGTTLFTLVVEREAEIGLMRSLGADDADVARVVLGEVTILGLAGGGVGLLLGALAARLIGWRLFGAAIDPRLSVVPVVLLISVGVSWLAVLVPLRRALAIRPAAALRAE